MAPQQSDYRRPARWEPAGLSEEEVEVFPLEVSALAENTKANFMTSVFYKRKIKGNEVQGCRQNGEFQIAQ